MDAVCGVSIKGKPYPKYKNSDVEWLGDVPEHWQLVIIKRCLDSLKDGTHGSFERVPQGIPLLSAKNVIYARLEISENESQISFSDYEEINRNGYLKCGDLLLTIVGTIGRATIFDLVEPIAFQRSVAVLRLKRNQEAKYFYYLSQSNYFQANLLSRAKQSAQCGIYLSDVAQIVAISPSLSEQRAIASFLDCEIAKLDALITKKEQLIELLKEKRAALISHAVTKGLDPNVKLEPSGVSWLGEVPDHWSITKLSHIASKIGDGLHGTPQYIDESPYHFINGNNLLNGSIAITDSTRCVGSSLFSVGSKVNLYSNSY